MTILERIKSLGLSLPPVSAPVANYVPAVKCGNEIRTSGQIPIVEGKLQYIGSIPSSQTVQDGIRAAEICGLNTIAAAASLLDGDVERITGVTQIKVYVASDAGFDEQSLVANGASDLMVAIFGEAGKHARVAMGSIGLPAGSTVEVEAVFETQE